jgi:protein required for attachment to host cells
MHKEVSDKVVAEISKDLTNMPPLEIERNIIGKPGEELN